MELARQATDAARPSGAAQPASTERIWFERTGFVPTAVYAREGLAEGTRIAGPALITQFDTTTLVPPGWALRVDAAMNLIMERNDD